MNIYAINLLLAGLWAALAGAFTPANLVMGFAVGFVALWAAKPLFAREDGYFLRAPRLTWLAAVFLYDLVVSSLAVAAEVLRVRPRNRPGIVATPLDARSGAELLTVSSLVTLTPGTLSLDVSDDGGTLYVHGMFVEDAEELRGSVAALKAPVRRAFA
ncbi:Na+/H+ antiporter subunit E [Rubrimonas cliftonensis]|uniref:Multicomponent Na+:H+ antiporter subunit E n=1 Tax=Rubrimonas cliftonensis TaxID=89524 RepID=A0A1H4D3C9_9RHOB|nr:Na+/H+ antiporter subunit E [Rubrimonas cliftonensis]SEA67224.1 multicomponent Na+:H+ antiporter subunit E [Rubrimonas cliftonensis]